MEPIKRIYRIFSEWNAEAILDGPIPSIDVAKGFETPFHPDPNTLYVDKVSQMPPASGITCALVADAPLTPEQTKGNNIFLFPPDTRPSDIFKRIEGYFAERTLHSRKSETIVAAYLRKESLESVVYIAHKELGRPITLYNLSFNILACAGEVCPSSAFRDELRLMSDARHDGDLPGLEAERWDTDTQITVFPLKNDGHKEKDVLVRIENEGKAVAYLHVGSEGKDLGYWDRELISVIIGTVGARLMDSAGSPGAASFPHEQFLIHLLDNSMGSAEALSSGARLLGMAAAEGFFALLLVSISQYRRIFTSPRQLRDELTDIIGAGHPALFEDVMALLLQYKSKEEYNGHDMSDVARYLEQRKLYGTRSRLFLNLEHARSHYTKAKKLLHLSFCAPEGKYLISFEDMGLFPVVDALLRTESGEDIIEPAALTLAAADGRKRTSYIETLYAYLSCSKNPTLTCKRLFIHRNTLDYRLQKITELTGIDWNDGDLMFRLQLSVSALKYIARRDG